MADLGSLIMSSSFFSRVSIRLSAPSDMTAASVGQSRVEYAKVCPNCVSLHVKPPLCSWLMAVGLAEQPWALSPPKSPPTGIVCTMRRKIFPKQRLPASRNLQVKASSVNLHFGFERIKITSHWSYYYYHLLVSERCIFQLGDKV